jgi:hypothetical protein
MKSSQFGRVALARLAEKKRIRETLYRVSAIKKITPKQAIQILKTRQATLC